MTVTAELATPAAIEAHTAINLRLSSLYTGRGVTAAGSVEREIVDTAIGWAEQARTVLEEAIYGTPAEQHEGHEMVDPDCTFCRIEFDRAAYR